VGGVVNVLVRQIKGDDLAVPGVNANVQLAPGAALCRAMLFKQPFAGAAQFQSGAIDDQVKFARSNPRRLVNRQSTRPPAQRRMIGNRQVDLQHFHDRSDQAFALAQRQSKHGA
jgi:hypothetical protein